MNTHKEGTICFSLLFLSYLLLSVHINSLYSYMNFIIHKPAMLADCSLPSLSTNICSTVEKLHFRHTCTTCYYVQKQTLSGNRMFIIVIIAKQRLGNIPLQN